MIEKNSLYEPHIISAIAGLLTEFTIDFETFSKALLAQYINNVYDTCHSFSRTALVCGIDRRIVSSTIRGEKPFNKQPLLQVIIEAIKNKAQNNKGQIAKFGIDSLSCIIDHHANGATTIKSVVDVLTQSGVIKDNGETFTVINQSTPDPQASQHLQSLVTQLTQSIADFKSKMQSIRACHDGIADETANNIPNDMHSTDSTHSCV